MTREMDKETITKTLLGFWKEVLGQEVSAEDEFFNIGGSSLTMFQLLGKISEVFSLEIEPEEFIEMASVRNIASYIAQILNKKENEKLKDKGKIIPPSVVQEAYYIGRNQEYDLGGISTHAYYEIVTEYTINELENGINELIKKQPVLRTLVLENGEHMLLEQTPRYIIESDDCKNCSAEIIENKIITIRNTLSQCVLEANKWPLFKIVALTGIQENKTYLFVHLDLLIMDGASIGIFMSQWNDYAKGKGKLENIFDIEDYYLKQKGMRDSKKYKVDKKYWLSKLDDFPAAPNLKLRQNVRDVKAKNFKRIQEIIDRKTYNEICEITAKNNVSPSIAFITAYAYILGFWSNQKNLSINLTTMDRPTGIDAKNAIGEFTKIVLLDSSVDATKSFWENAKMIQRRLLGGLGHRSYDGIEFIRDLMRESDTPSGSIMPVVFTSMLYGDKNLTVDALGEIKYSISQTSQVYLDAQISETKNGIVLNWDYMAELFDSEMIKKMFRQYIALVKSIMDENLQYPEISKNDKKTINTYNQTQTDIPETTIQDMFKLIAKAYSDKYIVVDSTGRTTCAELDEKSTQIANYLLKRNISKGSIVAVIGTRSRKTIINILGILKAGAAYVAIDPEYPEERKKYILSHSESVMCLDADFYEREEICEYSSEPPAIGYTPYDLAYIIYTSGSTGTPKGVSITQGAVMNTVLDINQKFHVTAEDKIIGLSSMCFDLSVYDIFGCLSTGATLVEVPDIHDVYNLAKVIKEEGITIWNSVPAIMEMMLDNTVQEETDFWSMEESSQVNVSLEESSLRLVLLSGDWIPVNLPDRIRKEYENAEVVSLGGATEASIWSIYYPIGEVNPEWTSIPYGMPLANQTYYVLNYRLEDCPIGVTGELYIGGKGLAQGYYRDPEKTAEAFIEHPAYGRIYRTGDYGVMTEKGYIIFQGRKDYQVKISGHRIELGEIESRLLQHKSVRKCAVVDWEDENKKKYLCAYVVSDTEIDTEELSSFLGETLPEYMVPKFFERIEEVPLNLNGKVLRKELKKPKQTIKTQEKVFPHTQTEKRLAIIWEEILGIQKIGIKDQFLRIGGDSIKMVAVLGKITEEFHVKISFREFITANTIEKMASLIEGKKGILKETIYKHKEHNVDTEYDEFPLTDVQMAYLIGRNEGIALGGISTHGYYEILTHLNIRKLEESLNKVIEIQPMLRAIISKSGTQKILKEVPRYRISENDIRGYTDEEQENVIKTERQRMSHYVFDTEKWPLFEFKAFRTDEEEYYLFVGIDLLIADGGSVRIFIRQLLDFYYDRFDKNRQNAFTFKDYVEALNDFSESSTYKEDKDYWMEQISLIPPAPMLPLQKDPSVIRKPQFARIEKVIPKSEWNVLQKEAKKKGITTSTLLCTAYALVLGYWSNQPELTINVTVFTRYPFNEGVTDIVGDFTSVILLRVNLLGRSDFWKLASEIQNQLMDALEHRHYDGMNVIRKIAEQAEMKEQAVMPVVFTSLLFSMEEGDIVTIEDLGEVKMGVSQTSQVYLDYQVMETKEGLLITWDYIKELFTPNMISTMFKQYINIVESLSKNVISMPHLDSKEQEVFTAYNDTKLDMPILPIQTTFKKIAEKYPEKILIADNTGGVTCHQVDKQSSQIANYLLNQKIKRGDVIAVLGNRRKETIINILGILKAGAAYVAIDPEYPEERKKYILSHSESVMCLDADFYEREEICEYSSEPPAIGYTPYDLAYIIYTSGSTGTPKGVSITQGAVMNTVLDINQKFHVTAEDKIIGLSSMCFDLSVYDIFGCLSTGATLVEVPDIHDVYNLAKVIKEEGITIWNSVPAIMEMMLDNTVQEETDFWSMEESSQVNVSLEESSLRLVLLSGDWIPVNLPDRIRKEYENAEVVSLGGATEASIWSIYYPIGEVNPEWTSIPYGMPLANQTYYVLNYRLEDCPIGVTGELYIGGKGLAQGYYRDPEKTAEAFIEHPAYGRIYRTGDYGVMTEKGYIIFQGRKDYQVKISGHRIELGEIESRLLQHKSVRKCAVVDWEDENKKKYLCAYVVSDTEIDTEELSSFLGETLPEYMVPKFFERIEEIPLNLNGKVEKKKLVKHNFNNNESRKIIYPRTKTERELVNIWKEILNLDEVSIKDSFLGNGGDSIKMVRAMSCISERLKVGISYKEFLYANTPEKLAKLIENGKSKKQKYEYPKYSHTTGDEYEEFPLTDVQMAYLLGRNDEFDLGGISTHGYYEVLTKLDIKKLEKSLNRTIKEQSMFRTVFSKSGMQRVLKYVPEYSITVEDLSLCSKKEQQEKILMERSRMSHYVFDVEKWPLFEFKAFKINSQEYYLFIGIDLLIADGSSMRILVRELKREYDYEATSSMQQKFDYKDYVHALEEFKNSDIYMEDKGYWTDRIDLLAPAPELPLKKELSEVKNPHFKRQQEIINNNIWENIKKEARNREITTSALLCSVYAAVLGYWSNQKDLTINVTVFTRYPFNPNVNNIIGDFTSVILLDVKLGEMSNLWDLAQRVQKQMMDALEHRHYDGINVIRELAKRKNMQQQAIMPVVFTSLLFSIDSEDNATINDLGEIKMGVSQTSQVYLDYQVMETKEGLSITWDYIEELFDEEVIGTMFLQYINALKNLDKPYSELLRPVKDDEAIIQKYNDTQCDIEETTIQREFKKVASKYPEHVIVSDIEGEMTCVELDKKSNQIAHYLISSGVKSGDIIGVMGKRKKETIMNIVGILKAGAAYVAIDPTYPKERQEYILSNSGSAYLLEPEFYETYNINQYSDTALDITYHPEDIAYLIYTSGSTGVPKGVVITQSAVMNTVLDINQKFSIDNTDKIIGLSSMCFDLSVYDIFGSLSTGAKLVEIEDIHDISYLERIVEKEGITVWNSVPAIMEMFLNGIGNERLFPTINTVLLSGDWIPVNMPNAIKKVCENARVVSLGGATEGSIWSIYYPVDYVDPEWKSIPYGKPLANQTYYVLNYEGRECPVGVSGELYIGGKGVAQGYFKDQEKTNKAFIVHPKYGRIYRTGDYGVLLKSGIIIFQGRKDSQIKIRGHRIEIGEIENQLLKHPKVKNCVVVDWEDDLGKKYLCGYFVSENNIDSKELQDMLRSKLPDYMIPKCFEQIGGIPLTANEKVDRNKLPKPEFKTKQIGKCIDPRTVKEKEVLKIWKEVLNLSDIGIYDDFYEMGGDSLSAMKVFSKLTQKYQISIKELYLYRNIASLSKMLRKKEPQIYFDFLKNQFKEMEHVLQYPTTEYLESYRNYLEKIDKDYNEIELETEEEYRTMLFIGATGFLGSHILYEFLSNTDVEIYAIIRGQSKESAGKRLRETLEFFDKYNPAWEQRIHVVVGDASIPKFGLEEETYEILRSKVDCIFNCAAIVSHLGLYEVMYKSNVLTCSNILKFAEKKKNIKIFHISTKHVGFGSVPDKKEVLFSESEFNVGQVIDNNYAKTKYEAETLMRAARDEGYNINIFRMGNISCELKGGKFQKNIEQNAFYILTRSFLRLGILPLSEQKTVDLTYVDSAARAIYLLATRKNLNNETYHIENTELLSFTHMGKMIQKYGENVVLRPYEDMWDYFLPIYEEGTDNSKMQEINNLIAYIDFLPWHMPTMFRFVKDKTKILLEKMGFAWKEPDQEIIDNLLDYGKQVGFFD